MSDSINVLLFTLNIIWTREMLTPAEGEVVGFNVVGLGVGGGVGDLLGASVGWGELQSMHRGPCELPYVRKMCDMNPDHVHLPEASGDWWGSSRERASGCRSARASKAGRGCEWKEQTATSGG